VDVSVSSRHVEVSEGLRQAAISKVDRLGRYLDGMDRAEIHFSEEQNPRIAEKAVCEVTLEGHGHHVRAKCSAVDGYAAVDQALLKLESQMGRLKTKLKQRNRTNIRGQTVRAERDAAEVGPDGQLLVEDDEFEPPRIVKSKRFAMMPMTPEDAVQRMELLGHGFFFFTNIDTHRAAVVYRRDDGDVGLIDEAD
jgi:putative sigma-54 modulation protein